MSHFLRAGLIAAASCTRYATTVAFGCESTFGEAQVAGGPASTREEREDRGAHLGRARGRSAPPIERTLGDRIEQVIAAARTRSCRSSSEAEIERIQEGRRERADRPRTAIPEPFLDYLMGNDE